MDLFGVYRGYKHSACRNMKPRRISDDVDGDSSVMKTCCCCMDVRLGTIVLGFCHLVSWRNIYKFKCLKRSLRVLLRRYSVLVCDILSFKGLKKEIHNWPSFIPDRYIVVSVK